MLAVPISNVLETLVPVPTRLRRLPTTCPLVLAIEPVKITLLEPVIMLPAVNVSVVPTVMSAGIVSDVLLMVRFTNVVALPVITCAPPLNKTVLVAPAVTVTVPLVNVPAIPIVEAACSVFVPEPERDKL